MAIKVGTLQVDLVANTASFTGPLDKAGQDAKKSARTIQDGFNGMDFADARGGLMLIDDLIGVRLPRHATSFISQIPGFQTAFAAMFPVAVAGVAIKAAVDFAESLKKQREELERSKAETLDTVLALSKHADALQLNSLRLQDNFDKLSHKLPQNGIVIAMAEGKRAVDDLIVEFDKALSKMDKLFEGQRQSIWSRLFGGGDTGQNAVLDKAKEFKQQISDLTQEMQTAQALGREKEAEEYKASLNQKISDFRAYIGQQQTQLEINREMTRKSLMAGATNMGPSGEQVPIAGENAADAAKHAQQQYAELQRVINDLTIVTESYGRAQDLTAKNNALAVKTSAKDEEEAWKKQQAAYADMAAEFAKKEWERLQAIKKRKEEEDKTNLGIIEGLQRMIAIQGQNAQSYSAAGDAASNRAQQLTAAIKAEADAHAPLAQRLRDEKIALQEINQQLDAQAAKLKQLTNDTMGGKSGSDQQKKAYQDAVTAYENMKRLQLGIERKYDADIANTFSGQMRRQLQDFTNLSQNLGRVWTQTMSNFSSTLSKFIVEGSADWRSFAATAIESLVEVGIQELIGLAIHQTIADKKKLTDAKSAFHGAYAATSDIPIIGPALAPIAGAAAFAAVMAFRQGGIVPQDAYALVHHEEMVLPANISNFIVNAAAGNASGAGGQTPIYMNFSPTIHALDAAGVDRVLSKHRDSFRREFANEVRRHNLGSF